MGDFTKLDSLLAWMRANGVKYAAVDGLVLELDPGSTTNTPLSVEELERLRHLKGWGDGFHELAPEVSHPALDPDLWGGSVPADVREVMKENDDVGAE